MRGRYLRECFRFLVFVAAIGWLAAPAAWAQRITDDSISALPNAEGPGDSTPSADRQRMLTEPPKFDPKSSGAVRAREAHIREMKEAPAKAQKAEDGAAAAKPESKAEAASEEPMAATPKAPKADAPTLPETKPVKPGAAEAKAPSANADRRALDPLGGRGGCRPS